jgi:hypothetical protein
MYTAVYHGRSSTSATWHPLRRTRVHHAFTKSSLISVGNGHSRKRSSPEEVKKILKKNCQGIIMPLPQIQLDFRRKWSLQLQEEELSRGSEENFLKKNFQGLIMPLPNPA